MNIRQIRNNIAIACFALCPASMGTFFWLFYKYFSTRDNIAHPDIGLVHPLNNHGSYVYLSDTESMGMAFLFNTFTIGFFLALFIVPKDFILPSPQTPRWLTYISFSAKTDLGEPSNKQKFIFCGWVIFYLGVIIFAGNTIVNFALSHGISHWI